jgi:hypothetical protein
MKLFEEFILLEKEVTGLDDVFELYSGEVYTVVEATCCFY